MTRQLLLWTTSLFLTACSNQTADKSQTDSSSKTTIDTKKTLQTLTTASYDYAYARDGKIYVYNESTKKDSFLTEGMNPCLSPSGQQVAFTESPNTDRQISVIDVQTKKKTRLAVDNNNFFGAMWSPDGNYIAFNYYVQDKASWRIGIIDKENRNFRTITNFKKWGDGAYSPTWTPDSKKIIVNTLDTIIIYQLDGTVIREYNVDSITKEHGISSNTNFFLTSDESKIIFNGTSEDESSGDGPSEAIYSFDFSTNKVSRITPKGLDCGEIFLQNNHVILFTAVDRKTNKLSAYKIKIGESLQLLFSDCGEITGRP